MSQHEQKDDLSVLEQMGYESRDIAAEKAAKFVGWTAAFTLAVFVASWFIISLVQWVTGAEAKVDPSKPYPGFSRLPAEPYPLLQSNRTAHKDTIDHANKEKEVLGTAADTTPGRVRIPITDAIKKTAEEGLPTRPGAGTEDPR